MTTLSEKIPGMSLEDLTSLRANAERLSREGFPAQAAAALEILQVIETEFAQRTPPEAPPKRVSRKKTTAPAAEG